MSSSAIGGFSNSSYVQQALFSALQSSGIQNAGSTSGTSGAARLLQADSSHLSPFAQLASALQQLQQSDPTKYAQVTQQIATNLQSAAQTAQSQGNSSAASQLTQLATDFSSASQSGQLPNLQDLAQAVGGSGGHHHHGHAHSDSDSGSVASSTASSGSSGSLSQTLNQILSLLQSSLGQNAQSSTAGSSTQSASLDPAAIILNTLNSAGVTVPNN